MWGPTARRKLSCVFAMAGRGASWQVVRREELQQMVCYSCSSCLLRAPQSKPSQQTLPWRRPADLLLSRQLQPPAAELGAMDLPELREPCPLCLDRGVEVLPCSRLALPCTCCPIGLCPSSVHVSCCLLRRTAPGPGVLFGTLAPPLLAHDLGFGVKASGSELQNWVARTNIEGPETIICTGVEEEVGGEEHGLHAGSGWGRRRQQLCRFGKGAHCWLQFGVRGA